MPRWASADPQVCQSGLGRAVSSSMGLQREETYFGSVARGHRSMFISFARGYLIGYNEIAEYYFRGKWGECIERTQPGVLPMYGRLVFISESYVDLVFKGEQLFNFVINGKCGRASSLRGSTSESMQENLNKRNLLLVILRLICSTV